MFFLDCLSGKGEERRASILPILAPEELCSFTVNSIYMGACDCCDGAVTALQLTRGQLCAQGRLEHEGSLD